MYRDNLVIKKTKSGEGVFSNIIIPPNKPIMILRGTTFKKDTISNTNDVIQIGPNMYLGMSGGIDDKVNHSCSPNSYIRILNDKAVLCSIYQIKPSMEISYDYSVSCVDESLTCKCSCNSINCRKIITDFDSLPINIINNYLKLNIVPFYVKHDMFKNEQFR